jgi:hypothetical protein
MIQSLTSLRRMAAPSVRLVAVSSRKRAAGFRREDAAEQRRLSLPGQSEPWKWKQALAACMTGTDRDEMHLHYGSSGHES